MVCRGLADQDSWALLNGYWLLFPWQCSVWPLSSAAVERWLQTRRRFTTLPFSFRKGSATCVCVCVVQRLRFSMIRWRVVGLGKDRHHQKWQNNSNSHSQISSLHCSVLLMPNEQANLQRLFDLYFSVSCFILDYMCMCCTCVLWQA